MSNKKGYFVYFYYSLAGDLLYVGKSVDVYQRYLQHSSDPYYSEIATVGVREYTSANQMNIMETYYIQSLKPLYNKADVLEKNHLIIVKDSADEVKLPIEKFIKNNRSLRAVEKHIEKDVRISNKISGEILLNIIKKVKTNDYYLMTNQPLKSILVKVLFAELSSESCAVLKKNIDIIKPIVENLKGSMCILKSTKKEEIAINYVRSIQINVNHEYYLLEFAPEFIDLINDIKYDGCTVTNLMLPDNWAKLLDYQFQYNKYSNNMFFEFAFLKKINELLTENEYKNNLRYIFDEILKNKEIIKRDSKYEVNILNKETPQPITNVTEMGKYIKELINYIVKGPHETCSILRSVEYDLDLKEYTVKFIPELVDYLELYLSSAYIKNNSNTPKTYQPHIDDKILTVCKVFSIKVSQSDHFHIEFNPKFLHGVVNLSQPYTKTDIVNLIDGRGNFQ